MATNIELAKELKEARARIKELEESQPQDNKDLEKRISDLEKENEKLKAAVTGSGSVSGWLISTGTNFNGETAGLFFRDGIAFILDEIRTETLKYKDKKEVDREYDYAKRKAEMLQSDFGYRIEHVDDFRNLADTAQKERIGKSMAEFLAQA